MTLLAVALLIWTLNGFVAACYQPSLRMPCRRKGPRQSYVTIGIRVVTLERDAAILHDRAIAWLLDKPASRLIGAAAVGGK